MWPFSIAKELRDLKDRHARLLNDHFDLQEAYEILKVEHRGTTTQAASVRATNSHLNTQNTTQAETIRKLTEQLEQASRNDLRGPDGKFRKRPDLVKG